MTWQFKSSWGGGGGGEKQSSIKAAIALKEHDKLEERRDQGKIVLVVLSNRPAGSGLKITLFTLTNCPQGHPQWLAVQTVAIVT